MLDGSCPQSEVYSLTDLTTAMYLSIQKPANNDKTTGLVSRCTTSWYQAILQLNSCPLSPSSSRAFRFAIAAFTTWCFSTLNDIGASPRIRPSYDAKTPSKLLLF